MATLTNKTIASSYPQLLSLPDGGGNGTTLVAITDGDAENTFALKLATDKAEIDGKLTIDQDSDVTALDIDTEATSAAGINITNPTQTTGNVIILDSANNLTTGRLAFLGSNSADTSTRNLVEIVNEHASATGATALKIRQDSTALALVALGDVSIGDSTLPRLSAVSGVDNGLRIAHASSDGDVAYFEMEGKKSGADADVCIMSFNNADSDDTYKRLGEIRVSRVGADNSGQFSFRTDNAGSFDTRMTITSAGNVGIGTESPLQSIDAVGKVIIADNKSDDTAKVFGILGHQYDSGTETEGYGLVMGYSTSSMNRVQIGGGNSDHNAATLIKFFTGANTTTRTGTEKMAIDSSGNVNIGGTTAFGFTPGLSVEGTQPSLILQKDASNFFNTNVADGFVYVMFDHAAQIQFGNATNVGGTGFVRNFILDTNSRISLSNNDSGTSNTVFGSIAGDDLASGGNYNSFFGHNAGHAVTTGDYNTAFGLNALDGSTVPDRCTALGTATLRGALTTNAIGSVAVGYASLSSLTSGQANTATGYETLTSNTTGEYNTAIGYLSLRTNVDGDHNTALGYASLYSFEAGSDGEGNNVAIGSNASFHLDTGQQNTMVGSSAGQSSAGTITYADNVGVGYKALFAITTGTNNVAIGSQAGDAMTDNVHNVIIGKSAFGSANSGESFNIVIGADAGTAIDNASADNNILIGQDAGTGGSGAIASCIAIGRNAMNSTGTNAQTGTIAIGHDSLTALTSGERNTAIGYGSLDAEDAGSNNTAVGYEALTAQNNDTGANTAVGMRAGLAVTTGYSNTLLGSGSGATLQGGYQNTYVGRDADGADGRINSTAVGFGTTAQADNSVTLGNDNVTAVYMASNSGAIVHATGLQNSGFYAYRLSGSKSVTADTLTDLFTVGHSHNYTITLWCLNNYTNQGQWFGQSQSVYGAATVTETLEKRNGSLSSIAVAYNNTGYKLQVTVGGVNATVYYTIDGLGSQDLVAL